MTLIISAGNSDNFIQLSDRRLSFNGTLVDDDCNKATVLVCKNARFAVGFTGLARYGSFETQSWLAETLCNCGPPDFDAKSILDRFAEKATSDFHSRPDLRAAPALHKRLSIMFTGFLYNQTTPRGALALISNFESLDNAIVHKTAQERFHAYYHVEPRPNPPRMKLFHSVGFANLGLFATDFNEAIDMVVDKLPPRDIEWKLVSYIRKISRHPSSANTVGEQISSVVIPSNRRQGFACSYFPTSARVETCLADFVCAISHEKLIAFKDVNMSLSGPFKGSPIVGPKLKSNQPCWCGSGQKFKRCHGSKLRSPALPPIDFSTLMEEIFKGKGVKRDAWVGYEREIPEET
jgi:hypothetical protein